MDAIGYEEDDQERRIIASDALITGCGGRL